VHLVGRHVAGRVDAQALSYVGHDLLNCRGSGETVLPCNE
jgi:hypothetical protein